MSIPRRRLLEVLGTAATVGSLAGWLSTGDTTDESTDTATATRSHTETPPTTASWEDTRTQTPGPDPQPPPARDIFDGVACPSFIESDRTVCWHTRDDDELAIRPSGQVFRPVSGNDAVETMTFTLRNTLDAPILFNPHSCALLNSDLISRYHGF
jgi:hypothetical protein